MFRTVGITLLTLLTMGVTALALGGWQAQRSLATRTQELSEQLATLTSTQQQMLAQQRPPEITGRCYLGDPSKPAANIEVQIFRFSDEPLSTTISGVIARRLRTDAEGRFSSGFLLPGEYCVLSPLVDADGNASLNPPPADPAKLEHAQLLFGRLQSAPLYLAIGAHCPPVELDLSTPATIELRAENIPAAVTIGDQEWNVSIVVIASTEPKGHYLNRTPTAPSDDVPRGGWPLPLSASPHEIVAGMSAVVGKLPAQWTAPVRSYYLTAQLKLDRKPPKTTMQSTSASQTVYATAGITTPIAMTAGKTSVFVVSLPGAPLQERLQAEYDKAMEQLKERAVVDRESFGFEMAWNGFQKIPIESRVEEPNSP